ncbi:MAG: glycosyltransferase [Acidobacteria bacterium]|nr:glycosyltransferase [Acidobacteriota bacterium]
MAAQAIELEHVTNSLLWRLKNRLLPIYMQLPYRLRVAIAKGVRGLLALGKLRSKHAIPLARLDNPASPATPAVVGNTANVRRANLPINVERCEQLVQALLAELGTLKDKSAPPKIDVIVPVYRGVEETLDCLASVLRSRPAVGYELIVIDDAGPEPELRKYLAALAAQGLLTLLHNAENLGFVKTVNRGMRLHPERDVVLLNSDTQVTGDWLDRLTRAAVSAPEIGTVTPLSNNATICSYPAAFEVNELPVDANLAKLDQLCAQINPGKVVEVPTAVGFCMYIRRACLNQVGYFDEQNFGRGYGEENDFCMRALAHGWRHVLTTDTFVYHAGNISFGAEHSPAKQKAAAILNKLHPTYSRRVQQHVADNPAKPARRRLDLARLSNVGAGPTVLFINHNMGGGVARHVRDLVTALARDGMRSVILQALGLNQVQLLHPDIGPLPNLVFDVHSEFNDLLGALRALNISHAHIHHTVGLPKEALLAVRTLRVPYDWTIHDYYSICPRLNLLDGAGRYCGEPDAPVCDQCIRKNGAFVGAFSTPELSITPWREAHAEWLAGARKVFVPHHSVGARLKPYFPLVDFEERRHIESYPQAKSLALPRLEGEPLRVAVLGVLVPHKGSELVLACAKDAAARRLPLSFHLIGQVHHPERFAALGNVTMTGEYKEEEVFAVLETQRCHCAFFASIIPETYSFTLSIALAARLFPVAFDLGAIGARIRESGWGHLFPLAATAAEINDYLAALSPEPPAMSQYGEPQLTASLIGGIG